MTSLLSVSHLTKTYPGRNAPCVNDLSLELQRGQILSILGPSGHGKTTALKLIAGHERPDAGEIVLDGVPLFERDLFVPPQKRPTAMVFQELALFPHLSVRDNILFGIRHLPAQQRERHLAGMTALLGLSDLLARTPNEISGGQKQRVALARALITSPQLLLLDEPFSALDTQTRWAMREELLAHLKALKMTTILVLHDQEDAFAMSDLILLMNHGQKEVCTTPQKLAHHPQTAWAADFFGHWTEIKGQMLGPNRVQTELFGTLEISPPPTTINGRALRFFLHPQAFLWQGSGHRAVVEGLVPLGKMQELTLKKDGHSLRIFAGMETNFRVGEEVGFDLDSGQLLVVPA